MGNRQCIRSAFWRAIPKGSALAADRGLPGEARGITPEALQTVEIPRRLLEDVDDEVTIVQQHPFPLGSSFGAQRPPSALLQSLVDRLGQCSDVGSRASRDDDEDLGDREQVADFEQGDVHALLVVQGVSCDPDEIRGF